MMQPTIAPLVPLSHALESGTAGRFPPIRDTGRDTGGTLGAKDAQTQANRTRFSGTEIGTMTGQACPTWPLEVEIKRDTPTKRCKTCREHKAPPEFPRHNGARDGRRRTCRECLLAAINRQVAQIRELRQHVAELERGSRVALEPEAVERVAQAMGQRSQPDEAPG